MSGNKTNSLFIWLFLLFFHVLVAFVFAVATPNCPNIGVLAIYGTVAICSNLGMPVFINPNSGWGWSEPNWFGWLLSVLIWVIGYLFVAFTISKVLPPRSKWWNF